MDDREKLVNDAVQQLASVIVGDPLLLDADRKVLRRYLALELMARGLADRDGPDLIDRVFERVRKGLN